MVNTVRGSRDTIHKPTLNSLVYLVAVSNELTAKDCAARLGTP